MPADTKPLYRAWIGLGSNLGDRAAQLRSAVEGLRQVGSLLAVSSMWETAPVGVTGQPSFLNAAAALATNLAPSELLAGLLEIERRHGRDRTQSLPKGPRTLDLDLLLVESEPATPGSAAQAVLLHQPGLQLPHPALHLRRFVLAPLAEIAPGLEHPLLHQTVAQLLRDLPADGPNHPNAVTISGTFQA